MNTHGVGVKTEGDKLLVTYSNDFTNDRVNIRIVNCNGKRFQNITVVKPGFTLEKQFNISGLSKGIYIVKVANESRCESKKIAIN